MTGIRTLNQNLGGCMSLLNTHGFSPLVKETRVPLSLLGALCSTRLKAFIDLPIAHQAPWQSPPLWVQEAVNIAALVFTGKTSCSHRHYPILCNVEWKKNGSWTRAYNCRRSEWREGQQPSYPRVNEFRIYLNHLVHSCLHDLLSCWKKLMLINFQ